MDIQVSANKTLGEISDEFHKKFPYLKIEFFSKEHEEGEANKKSSMLDHALTVSEAGTFDHEEEISINGHLKVDTLEHHFQEVFGIGLQVFRRSGKLWLQTTTTDHWTLSEQNRTGEEDSKEPDYSSI